MTHLGKKIREIREEKKLLLRQIAAHLEVDTALISKIETGERKASKEQILKIAKFLDTDIDDLLIFWLADKIEAVIGDEKRLASNAMSFVKRKMKK